MTYKQLGEWFGKELKLDKAISQSSIGTMMQRRTEVEERPASQKDAKRPRATDPITQEVEIYLHQQVMECQKHNIPINYNFLTSYATNYCKEKNIDMPHTFSSGWITGFMQRYGLKIANAHGESGSAPDLNNVDSQEKIKNIREQLNEYPLERIYNFDETALFYSAAPRSTIIPSNDKAQGQKLDKSRITTAIVVNADGSHRINPFFIGKSERPACFKGKSSGFRYYWNDKAWMTSTIFNSVVKIIDRAAGHQHNGKKSVLLLDNASSHNHPPPLANLEIIFLPPNTTSKLQPLDAGIIAAFKKRFRSRQYANAALNFKNHQREKLFKLDILTAMKWSTSIMQYEITSTTIKNCFKTTTLLDRHFDNQIEDSTPTTDDDDELDSHIDTSLTTIYGDDYIRANNVDYHFDDNVSVNDMTTDVAEDKEEEDYIHQATPPVVIRKELK
jgi:hypothetical protein